MEDSSAVPSLKKLPFLVADGVLVAGGLYLAFSRGEALSTAEMFVVVLALALGGALGVAPFLIEHRNRVRLAEYDAAERQQKTTQQLRTLREQAQKTDERFAEIAEELDKQAGHQRKTDRSLDQVLTKIDERINEVEEASINPNQLGNAIAEAKAAALRNMQEKLREETEARVAEIRHLHERIAALKTARQEEPPPLPSEAAASARIAPPEEPHPEPEVSPELRPAGDAEAEERADRDSSVSFTGSESAEPAPESSPAEEDLPEATPESLGSIGLSDVKDERSAADDFSEDELSAALGAWEQASSGEKPPPSSKTVDAPKNLDIADESFVEDVEERSVAAPGDDTESDPSAGLGDAPADARLPDPESAGGLIDDEEGEVDNVGMVGAEEEADEWDDWDLAVADDEDDAGMPGAVLPSEESPGEASEQPSLLEEDAPSGAPARHQAQQTTLVAHVLIGIGNKPYVRGTGPGLSLERGVPMDFLEIGKWQWTSNDAGEPIEVHIYKNDDIPSLEGPICIQPGQRKSVSPKFPS